MIRRSVIEVLVGIFMILGIAALAMLAFQVSGLAQYNTQKYYVLHAAFDNIGSLKNRAPVSIGGVRIGQVTDIKLDSTTFQADVTLHIDDKYQNSIPTDSAASILTQGLLGSNYVSITPGYENSNLKNGDEIQNTHSAIILENLIGQLIYSVKGNGDKSTDKSPAKNSSSGN